VVVADQRPSPRRGPALVASRVHVRFGGGALTTAANAGGAAADLALTLQVTGDLQSQSFSDFKQDTAGLPFDQVRASIATPITKPQFDAILNITVKQGGQVVTQDTGGGVKKEFNLTWNAQQAGDVAVTAALAVIVMAVTAAEIVIVHSSDLHIDHDYTARLHGGDGTVNEVVNGILGAVLRERGPSPGTASATKT